MRFLCLLALTLLLPSCAYVQTHKNVRERGRVFRGYQLEKPSRVYQSGNNWYIAATPATFRQHHDPVHDKVLRQSTGPHMTLLHAETASPAFHPISPHTATVLMRADGYADSTSLCHEINQSPDAWKAALPGATSHPVRALVQGESTTAITSTPTPAEPSFSYRFLSGLDFVFVDIPGTLVYNCAVPFIVPFVFFQEFMDD